MSDLTDRAREIAASYGRVPWRAMVMDLVNEIDRLQAAVDRFERALEISACDIAPCKGCGVPVAYRPAPEPLCVPCDWAKGRDEAIEAETGIRQ